MLVFWGTVIAMLGVALFVILRPLFRPAAMRSRDGNETMVGIYRNRLQEMEAEVSSGVLSAADAETARTELAHTLLLETEPHGAQRIEKRGMAASHWWTAGGIALLIPVIAVMMYLRLGTPDLVDNALLSLAGGTGDPPVHAESMEAMVRHLAERLEQNPEDPEGWIMLVNSYMTLGRHAEALDAIERLYQMTGDDPAVLVRYADILATVNGGDLAGKPSELLQRALVLDPKNVIGLWLAGMAAARAGNPAAAIDYWNRVLPLIEADPASRQEINELIAQARAQSHNGEGNQLSDILSDTDATGDAQGTLTVKVNSAPAMLQDLKPEYALFIVARAVSGPPLPVAVIRKTVADLPLEINMDDSNSMMPDRKLSSFAQLEVSARIAPAGNALPQPGDLVSAITVASPGQEEPVTLVIDRKVP